MTAATLPERPPGDTPIPVIHPAVARSLDARTGFEVCPDALWVADRDLILQCGNSAFFAYCRELHGRELGAGEELLLLFPEILRERWRRLMQQVLAGTPVCRELEISREGVRRQFEYSLIPVRDGDRIIGLAGSARECTARHALEMARLREAGRLATGALAASLSENCQEQHALLLTVTRLMQSRIAEGTDAATRSQLSAFERAATRCKELARQLDSFTCLAAPQVPVVRAGPILRDEALHLGELLGTSATVRFSRPAQLPRVRAEGEALREMIVQIALETQRAALAVTRWLLSVEAPGDSQPGAGTVIISLAPDMADGMGKLAWPEEEELTFRVLRWRVERWGGRLRRDENGVRLHLASANTPDKLTPPPAHAPRHDGDGPRYRILVVEDEDKIRELVVLVLTHKGYKVQSAPSAVEALILSDAMVGPPDLLVTDVIMPKMSGRELCDSLRERWPGLPVLFMSGHTGNALDNMQPSDARTAFIGKPFTPRQLLDRVAAALGFEPTG